ncbi:transmembrane and immunoglobulin domain-containing protein 2 [Paramisgurnus dabryanus]|uniref:transmembrane and immunoglobulin domain-containing protein 2 n=1 Tax=Paramisgurnus dabryanus TaxID=90735 RepID=UPI0031F37C21
MKSNFAFFIIISITGHIPVFGLSVHQTPLNINTSEEANVSINCHIESDTKTHRLMVLWLKNNLTEMLREIFNTSESEHRLYSGNVSVTSTLHLHSLQPIHTGVYYCKITQDVPTLTTVYGKGTRVYIVNSSTDVTVTTSAPSESTVMISSLSVLGILVLIFCIAFVIHIQYKKQQTSDLRARDALVDAIGRQSPVISETSVIYAAISIQKNQEGVKTRNKNCEAQLSATVSCTEVTYSQVHIKSQLKDEG